MPGMYINLAHTVSQSGVYVEIRQQATTSLGDYWNGTAWVTSPTASEEELALTETPATSGFYWADIPQLSTYTGWLSVVTYTSSDVAISAENRYVSNGVENPFHVDTDTLIVNPSLTFRLSSASDSIAADNQLTLNDTDEVTIAFDFSQLLNHGAILASVSGVAEETANSITIASIELSADKRRVHCHVSGLTASTVTTLRATVVTSDGSTIARLGTFITE